MDVDGDQIEGWISSSLLWTDLFKRLKNLQLKDMIVKYYTKVFYMLNIQFGHRELLKEKVDQYINGLRFNV